jgi:hypothetical protein
MGVHGILGARSKDYRTYLRMYSTEGDLRLQYGGPDSTDIAVGADRISTTVRGISPFFIGRNGSTEQEAISFWFTRRRIGTPWPQRIRTNLHIGAGVWPATDESLDKWAEEYMKALGLIDGLAAGWYRPFADSESALLDYAAPTAFRTPLRSLEPYYCIPNHRWTRHLSGKRVAVVSSFADTIQSQVESAERIHAIWNSLREPNTVLSLTATWIPIRTYFPPEVALGDSTQWPDEIRNWDEAATYIVEAVKASGATVAIIGCGGLGMIIGGRLKALGISVVVMGGAIQVLFGIKGRRWEKHEVISKFWGPYWVWPRESETPRGSFQIEGGCYWKLGGSAPSTTPR